MKLNPFSNLYATAANHALSTMTVKDKADGDKAYKRVEVIFRDTIVPILIDTADKQYHVLPGIAKGYRSAYGDVQDTEIQKKDITLTKWRKFKEDIPADDAGIQALACSIITRENNYKAVRFCRWGALKVSDITSRAYHNPTTKTVVATAIVAIALTTGVLAVYKYKLACGFNIQNPTPANTNVAKDTYLVQLGSIISSGQSWARASRFNVVGL